MLRITRVVLIGDFMQLDAVDASKPYAKLQQAGMRAARMDQIMRQRDPELKAAVKRAWRATSQRHSKSWTPMRFAAIHFLSQFVDEELLKEAWALCITKKDKVNRERIVDLLGDLKARIIRSDLQPRVKELFTDAFEFGIRNSLALDFGIFDKKLVSPNAVGFEFVVRAIARRSRKRKWKGRTSIKIDRQQQFNDAQFQTHYNLARIAEGLEKAGVAVRDAFSFHPMSRNPQA